MAVLRGRKRDSFAQRKARGRTGHRAQAGLATSAGAGSKIFSGGVARLVQASESEEILRQCF